MISAIFVMVGMLFTGSSAYMNQNYGLLIVCGAVFLCCAGLVGAWVIQRCRHRPQPERTTDPA